MPANPLLRGRGRLINMNPLHRGAWRVRRRASDGVVEDHNLVAAGDVAEEEVCNFRVVVGADGIVRGEGRFGRRRHGEDGEKGVVVEVVRRRRGADVVDLDGLRIVAEVSLRETSWRSIDVVKGGGAVGRSFEEVEGGGYGTIWDLVADCHHDYFLGGRISTDIGLD